MYKAVIVDDESIIVTGLVRMLPWQKYNCEVVGTAEDGERALKLIRRTMPDMLFTDIRMPGMDGLSLIAALRSEFPQMQITILSGYPDFEYAQRAIALGVNSYILKPSKMAELEEALRGMAQKLDALKSAEKGREVAVPPKEAPAPSVAKPIAGSEATGESAGNFIVNNALQYIEEHYAEKLSLSDVADNVYVSQWHLSKLIGKITGQSFSDLLNGVRIRNAKELLKDPSLKIWEISERVGFSDVTHFSRIFKKVEGCSANEYRNTKPSPNNTTTT